MEESFLLKHYGHLDMADQLTMTAEERHWWLERLDKENKNQKALEESASKSESKHTPGVIPP